MRKIYIYNGIDGKNQIHNFLRHANPKIKKKFEFILRISLHSAEDLDRMFAKLDFTHPAFAPYNIFKQASDTVRSGIIIGLGARLQVFQNEMIRNITTYNEINLVEAGKRKCAYFCITSDQDSTFDFLASLFFSFLFIRLVRYADNYGEGGKLPVELFL